MGVASARRRVVAILPEPVATSLRWIRRSGQAVLRAGAQPARSVARSFDANLRRVERWRHRRIVLATLTAGLVVAAAVGVGIVVGNWIALLLVVAVFGIEAATLAWRARPGRGRGRGWPAGDLVTGPEALTKIDHISSRAARFGPVFKTGFLETPTCCVVDLDLGTALLREHADQLGPPWGPYERFVPGGSVRGADAERSAELRRWYARALTVGLVRSWEPALARCTDAVLGALADDPESPAAGVDPRAAVRATVKRAWAEVMFGIAADAPEFAEMSAIVEAVDPDRGLYGRALPDAEVDAELDRLAELVRHAAATRDRSLVTTTLGDRFEELEPGALTDQSLVRNLVYTMITSHDDVAGLLVWVLWYVTQDPSWVEQLRSDPDGATALADRIVSETLRLEQSEFVMRRVLADVHFRGTVIPKGWFVRVCIKEIHRDPAKIAAATTFDPDRFLSDGGRRVYAPFGVDHRFCLGEVLTRTMARVFLVTLADEFDWVTRRDGERELSAQRHWSPSSRWELVLRRRRHVADAR